MTSAELSGLLVEGAGASERIASALDGLDHEHRVAALSRLDRATQRRLYRIAADSPAVTLDHFVPPGAAPAAAVIHFGRNTLPLPRRHRFFEKRFFLPGDGSRRLFGYNEAPSRWLVGPGYFVAVPTTGRAGWQSRGAVVIDYFQVPDGPVAPGWPAVVPNTHGLQRFVYHGTRDFMRAVSSHVSIGAAYKGEKALDHYFVLCRLDVDR